MNCPVCQSENFSPAELDAGLNAFRCESCAGDASARKHELLAYLTDPNPWGV